MSTLSDLAKVLGDTACCLDDSTLTRALYSSDASLYRVVPQIVAHPRSVDELRQVVQAALELGIPITGRGAGTSCAGNAVGTGIVIDCARHLNRIIEVDPESRTAIVEPGVVQADLQAVAAPHGLRFGPDPSTSSRCTIGGMIGNNACGPRALGYGRSADNVVALDMITGHGKRLRIDADSEHSELRSLVMANLGVIRTQFGTFTRQVSGYSLEHLLPEKGFNLPRFFAGTEGTLGIITRATVRLVTDAPIAIMVALGYPTMADAGDDISHLLKFSPTACEGLDARIVDVVRRAGHPVPDLPRGEGWMFIELVGEEPDEVHSRATALLEAASALEGWVVDDPARAKALWKIRADGAGLAGISLPNPAYGGWEDAAVPPARLGEYLRAFDDLLAKHRLHGLPYGHFGEGCVHCRIDFPLDSPGAAARYKAFVTEAAELVASFGGSMSGEHGDGRARSALLPIMYSPAALHLFGQVKRIFDPRNLLNPGVLVAPRPVEADLRMAAVASSPLRVSDPDFVQAVHQCSGVGKCLANNTGIGGVMCPSYQATREEKNATRGRARVLQEMINGSLISQGWRSPEVHEALELCLSCKGCARDCPTGIDMASYKSRVLFEAYRRRPRPRSHYALGWLPRWGRLITRVRGLGTLVNLTVSLPGLGRLMKWCAGVDRRRSVPRFVNQSARSTMKPTGGGGKGEVLIWVDSFSDCFEGTGLAAMWMVLERLGYSPRVLDETACCGLTWITTGQLDGARRQLRRAAKVLAPYLESNVPIIGLEPSCTAVWRRDAQELLPGDERVAALKGRILTLAEFLTNDPDFVAPDLSDHTIVVQPHCHHASVIGWSADAALLASTEAEVVTVGGCCGLAGNFGVELGHHEVSVKVFEHDLGPAIEAHPEAIVLADGFSCRTQLSSLAKRDSMTLAELLAAH